MGWNLGEKWNLDLGLEMGLERVVGIAVRDMVVSVFEGNKRGGWGFGKKRSVVFGFWCL